MDSSRPILVVEDSHEDYEMISRAIERLGVRQPVYRLVIGSDALDYLNRRMSHQKRADEPLPGLILLDIHLPAADGREILREIKGSARFRNIPVVVLSTSTNPSDILACYAAGVNSYIIKSVDTDEYSRKVSLMLDYWTSAAEIPD